MVEGGKNSMQNGLLNGIGAINGGINRWVLQQNGTSLSRIPLYDNFFERRYVLIRKLSGNWKCSVLQASCRKRLSDCRHHAIIAAVSDDGSRWKKRTRTTFERIHESAACNAQWKSAKIMQRTRSELLHLSIVIVDNSINIINIIGLISSNPAYLIFFKRENLVIVALHDCVRYVNRRSRRYMSGLCRLTIGLGWLSSLELASFLIKISICFPMKLETVFQSNREN